MGKLHSVGEISPYGGGIAVIDFNGDPYISVKGLQHFLGLKSSEMYRKLKKCPRSIYDLYFNPTVLSKENKGKKLINLRVWKEEGMGHSLIPAKRKKKVVDFRPKKRPQGHNSCGRQFNH